MPLRDGRRELMAIGWDAACDEAERQGLIGGNGEAELKADNPYRKPVIDLSGAIICKVDDE